jgi:hypothetical protein
LSKQWHACLLLLLFSLSLVSLLDAGLVFTKLPSLGMITMVTSSSREKKVSVSIKVNLSEEEVESDLGTSFAKGKSAPPEDEEKVEDTPKKVAKYLRTKKVMEALITKREAHKKWSDLEDVDYHHHQQQQQQQPSSHL